MCYSTVARQKNKTGKQDNSQLLFLKIIMKCASNETGQCMSNLSGLY